ncbi:MAG: hypothetical protein QNK82_01475 [Akkermansiaceae bacterium]
MNIQTSISLFFAIFISSCHEGKKNADSKIYGVWKSDQDQSYESMLVNTSFSEKKKAAFKANFGKTQLTFLRDGICETYRPSYKVPMGGGNFFTSEESKKESKFEVVGETDNQIVMKFEDVDSGVKPEFSIYYLTFHIKDDDTISLSQDGGRLPLGLPGREYFKRVKK